MPIVDAHTHIFPAEIVRDRERFLARDAWFGQLYSRPTTRLATAEEIVASMDECGIDISVVCGFPWRDQGMCRFHNDSMCEAARLYPGRIAWLGICSPVADGAAQLLDEAFQAGAAGAGELNADAQGFDLTSADALRAVAEVCISRERPVMLHASEPVGHDYPGKGSATPDKLVKLLTAFPELKVVAAHWGGGLPFYELMPEVRIATKHLVYDSAASTYLYDHQVFEIVTSLAGDERVMFGSDYPVLKQGPLLARCRTRSWASDAALAKVLGENAVRIYGLEGMNG